MDSSNMDNNKCTSSSISMVEQEKITDDKVCNILSFIKCYHKKLTQMERKILIDLENEIIKKH